jgi:TetR/AcrR family transcriptional regulator, copper-responsive repressor
MKQLSPRGRPREFDRDKALDRALETFWQWGYDTASIALLTRAMGITSPALYGAFGSKEGLFLEAVERYSDSSNPLSLESAATAREGVEVLLFQAAKDFTASPRRRGCFIICAASNITPESQRIATVLRKRREAGEAAILRRIEQGLREGELQCVDARALAKFYATVYQGMSVQARDGASSAALIAVARQAMATWPTDLSTRRDP